MGEALVADIAHIRPNVAMRLDVLPETGLRGEVLVTHFAGELVEVLHVPMHLHLLLRVKALKGTKIWKVSWWKLNKS